MYQMSKSPKIPRLIDRLTKEIKSNHNPELTLNHEKTWRALPDEGIWPCDPEKLSNKLQDLLCLDEYQPKGERLLHLTPRDKFTLLPSMKPMRPEEALERLIVQSNLGTTYGQMPTCGRKEGVDIVHLKNKVGTFIELKSWRNKDTPLFATLEGIKNLGYFNVLKSKKDHRCKKFLRVNLMVLAPFDYYQKHYLLNKSGKVHNLSLVKKYIESLSETFKTNIQIFALNWDEEDLLEVCKEIHPIPPKEKVIISVSGYPPVESLLKKNWIKII
jgi:hypothetical protein